ncbi:MAG: sigma-54 dependent transcriptional regulator [Myxococcota bacterium]|nr:sigma-54 dependent transcriptional regulator [Myxococcota bacterium]
MTDKGHILVVDDERSMREFLEIFFQREGYRVSTAPGVDEAEVCLENDEVDIVITDMQMPKRGGLDLLSAARDISPDTAVVVITAYASTDSAIAAMREGAYDYITKPFKVDEIRLVVDKALEKKQLALENQLLKSQLQSHTGHPSIIGHSRGIREVFELISQVAETRASVLIFGESGTGKELVARALHDQSDRIDESFVGLNCGAIPENLLESELFGHEKGAFTGAVGEKKGLFEVADGGTLFLDEIAELSLALQVKLLRAIQEKTIRRVGGTADIAVDVRLLSATNRDLEAAVAEGQFRNDLFYRLNVIQISIPALRERREDIPPLLRHFLTKLSAEAGRDITSVSEEAMKKIMVYDYPGNVRELENIVERAVALSRSDQVQVEALPPNVLDTRTSAGQPLIPAEGVKLEGLLDDYERSLISEALRLSGGVKKEAARLLGVSFRSFRYRLEKLEMESANLRRGNEDPLRD